MSTRAVTTRATAARRSRAAWRRRRRRRITLVIGVALLSALAAAVALPRLPDVVRELALPLSHEDIIRQQASAKELDPSLLAAVIYAESRFRDRTSHAGARGLMQITPETARYIAHL
jgi:soluble lytic murein transglycosylase